MSKNLYNTKRVDAFHWREASVCVCMCACVCVWCTCWWTQSEQAKQSCMFSGPSLRGAFSYAKNIHTLYSDAFTFTVHTSNSQWLSGWTTPPASTYNHLVYVYASLMLWCSPSKDKVLLVKCFSYGWKSWDSSTSLCTLNAQQMEELRLK